MAKQKMKGMPAVGKRGGNWHFRARKKKDKMMRKRF
jgi:hypothetical protein